MRATGQVVRALRVVACAVIPVCASAQTAVRASVTGTVFDSVGMKPLLGAVVRVVRSDDPSVGLTARTDAAGAFRFDSVPPGIWAATFLHPVLDSLHLEPMIVRLEITESGVVEMPLNIPSGRSLVKLVCGSAMSSEFGLIVGEVRRAADGVAMVGATLEVTWPEWVLGRKKLVTDQRRASAVTDSAGRYALCGAPAGSTLRTIAWSGADSSGVLEVTVSEAGFAVQDIAVSAVEYVQPSADRSDATSTPTRIRTGKAIVRGRVVTTAGIPLPNAVVRVIGSGTPARTSETGDFTIADAASGTQSIEARAIGYSPYRRTIELTTGIPVDVALSLAVRSVQLDTVRVLAGRDIPYTVQGIERRWRTGLGTFLDARMVRERSTMFTTDALRGMAGVAVRLIDRGFGQEIIMRNNRGEDCRASLFVDGVAVDAAGRGGLSLDEFSQPDAVAAVEVYARPSMAPAEYLTMARNCGVVAVWTKFGTGNVPVLPPKSARRKN